MNIRNKETIEKIRNMKPPEDCIGLSDLAKKYKTPANQNKEFIKNIVFIIATILALTSGLIIGSEIQKNKCKRYNYDVNNDGKVDILDLLLVKKYILNEGQDYEK